MVVAHVTKGAQVLRKGAAPFLIWGPFSLLSFPHLGSPYTEVRERLTPRIGGSWTSFMVIRR